MSKTIVLTSKRDSTPYTWTGDDDTHTFANLPYGEYDVKIEESGYKIKTHTINHQGANTYQYTLYADDQPKNYGRLLKTVEDGQYSKLTKYIYLNEVINDTVQTVVIDGTPYKPIEQSKAGMRTRLAFNETLPETINAPIELWGGSSGADQNTITHEENTITVNDDGTRGVTISGTMLQFPLQSFGDFAEKTYNDGYKRVEIDGTSYTITGLSMSKTGMYLDRRFEGAANKYPKEFIFYK